MNPIVVILGCRPEGENPTAEMVKRVRHGIGVADRIAAPAVVFSGGRTSGRYSEAHLMHRIAEEEFPWFDLPSYIEARSLDTIGNAYFSARILQTTAYAGLCVVTSPYHIERAEYIFRRVIGGDITGDTFGLKPEGIPRSEEEGMELARMLLADVRPGDLDEIWRRMKNSHPYYSDGVR